VAFISLLRDNIFSSETGKTERTTKMDEKVLINIILETNKLEHVET